jgi:integrase
LKPADILDRKLILNDTKSGKEQELIFIPQKVADRLKEYVRVQKIARTDADDFSDLLWSSQYGAARAMVGKAGKLVGIRLRPHDLRRHAATFASRSNVPLEIISKVILRHSSLQTTEIYLGKVSDTEAIRWIENLYS